MNTAVATAPVTTPPKRDAVCVPQHLGLVESKRHDYVADIPEEHTREDLLQPGYWAHVATMFAPFDRIECRSETGEWFSDLVVISSGRNYAVMREVQHVNFTDQPTAPVQAVESKHHIVWKGPKKFVVVRNSDKAIISEGHHTRTDAQLALDQYEARIAS